MDVTLLSHVTNSALVVYLIQWLKGTARYQRFAAWLPIADNKVHVLMSAIGAFATGLGMHGAVEGSYIEGYHLTLLIPPLWVILHTLWDGAQQMALNQIVFAISVQQKAAAPVLTAPVQGIQPVTVTVPLTDAIKEKP